MNAESKFLIAAASPLLSTLLLSGIMFVGPLVCWLIWKDQDPVIGDYAKHRLNASLSWFAIGFLALLSYLFCIAFVLVPAVALAWLVICIIDIVKALQGDSSFRYPLTFDFIK